MQKELKKNISPEHQNIYVQEHQFLQDHQNVYVCNLILLIRGLVKINLF